MALRASSELEGSVVDLSAVTEGDGSDSNIDAAPELVAFAEAATRGSEALATARETLRRTIGDDGLVEAAGVIGNFERMVRIADGTGIPLDDSMRVASEGVRQALGLDRFASAANTPPLGSIARSLGKGAQALVFGVLRQVGRIRSR